MRPERGKCGPRNITNGIGTRLVSSENESEPESPEQLSGHKCINAQY